MTIHIEKEGSRLDDYDFKECAKYAPFQIWDIEDILACWPGEADGDNWDYIVKLKNGTFGWITGGCDYTGWGCQENGEGKHAKTAEEAIFFAPEERRDNLRKQVDGSAPYALK